MGIYQTTFTTDGSVDALSADLLKLKAGDTESLSIVIDGFFDADTIEVHLYAKQDPSQDDDDADTVHLEADLTTPDRFTGARQADFSFTTTTTARLLIGRRYVIRALVNRSGTDYTQTVMLGSIASAYPGSTVVAPSDEAYLRALGDANAESVLRLPSTGGTGLTTYSAGDMLYAATTNPTALSKLAIGSAGKFLRSSGTAPAWSTATMPATAAAGDMLYGSATNVWSPLAIGTVNQVLTSTGAVPAWSSTLTLTSVAATTFTGAFVGNASTATLAAAATILATGRTIAITGDLAYTSGSFDGSGNVTGAGTLATVNGNVGSFGGSTAIPVLTVNAKGLVTAAGTAVVVAPAGTLSGTTLSATVVASSLTSVGVLAAPHMTSAVVDSGGLTITAGGLTATLGDFTAGSVAQQLKMKFKSADGYFYLGATDAAGPDLVFFNASLSEAARITNAGVVVAASGVTVTTGGISVAGNSTITGTLGGITNLTLTGSVSGGTTIDGTTITPSVRLALATNQGSFVAGSVYKNSTNGLTIGGITGATNDLLLTNNAGQSVLAVTAGTQNVVLSGGLTGTTAAFTGLASFANGIVLTGGSLQAGAIVKDASNGLTTQSATGSVNDWSLLSPSGTGIARVATGTTVFTVISGLAVTAGGIAVTGNSTVTGTLGVTQLLTASNGVAVTGGLTTTGDLNVNSGKFIALAASGNTTVAGTLTVTGTITGNGSPGISTTNLIATLGFTGSNGAVDQTQTAQSSSALVARTSHATYNGSSIASVITRAASTAFSHFLATSNGVTVAAIDGTGSPTFAGTVISPASATGASSIRIPSGTAPSSPTAGDVWYDGTNLKFRDGGTTRTITWT